MCLCVYGSILAVYASRTNRWTYTSHFYSRWYRPHMNTLCDALRDATVAFRVLSRPLDITEPCAGISAYRELTSRCNLPYNTTAFDTDQRLEPCYSARNLSSDCVVNIGLIAGDVLQIDLASGVLDGSEALLAGPPCQHINESGNRLGVADSRSLVFDCILDWVIHLAWQGTLLFFCLENSPNIQRITDERGETYEAWVLRKLRVSIPFYSLEVVILCAYPTLPHSRTRWWLRALRDSPAHNY